MPLAVTYKYQPPTTIDDNLQAHMEARDIGEPDADGEGEGEDEEAEEPKSASDNNVQEDDENDDFNDNSDRPGYNTFDNSHDNVPLFTLVLTEICPDLHMAM